MKQSPIKRRHSPLRRSKLRLVGVSPVSELKREIQALVRQIVIKRDGGCVLRKVYGIPRCNGYRNDGEMILQADHLITRANSATYGDTRLIVCACQGHHGWKKWHEKQYEAAVRSVLSPERVALWGIAEEARWRPTRTTAMDWKLVKIALTQELERTQPYVEPLAK